MHSQNCHKAPQKKKEEFEKLGEGVFFKEITFSSERKTNVNFPIAPGKIQGWINILCLFLYTYPYPLLQYRFKSG
jgi:hypothetical protein